MTWFRVDDKFFDHPKALRAGKDARNLWFRVGVSCSAFNTDGLVDGDLIPELAPQAGVTKWRPAVQRLVDVGLWHDHETIHDCTSCADQIAELTLDRKDHGEAAFVVPAGSYFFHQWWERQEEKKAKRSAHAKAAYDRMRALQRDTDLCRAIQLRDADRCRYCGTEVHWNDRRSPKAPTYDHLDPFDFDPPDGGNSLDKVVVACRTCNGRKGKRTVQEWVEDPKKPGLPLLPPPTRGHVTTVTKPAPISTPDLPGPPDPGAENPAGSPDPGPQNPAGPSRDARLGSGQVRARSGPGSGAGLAGLVRGGAGPGLDGTGLVGFGPGREPPTGGTTDPPPDRTRAAADHAEDSEGGLV